jgi:signal transduction histidine kinase
MEAAPQLRLLSDITEHLNSGKSVEELFQLLYVRLKELIPYHRIALALTDKAKAKIKVVAVKSDDATVLGKGYTGEIAGSSLEPLIRDGRTRIINDLITHLKERPQSESTRLIVKEGMRSSLTLPLLSQGQAIGVMFFSCRDLHAYSPDHEELLRNIVGQMAVAIERSNLFDRLREQEADLARSQNLAAIGELAATIAHEIKNPLAGISGAIQVLEEAIPLSDRRRFVVGEILDQIRRLDNTVRDLLTFSRPALPERHEIPLAESLSRAWSVLAHQPGTAKVHFQLVDPKNICLHGDPQLFHQVWINLFQNAIEAMAQGGTLSVTIQEGNPIQIQVQDTGTGMDSATAAKIFRPFFSTKTRGTGLGLAISRKIVEAHGGTMQIESAPNQGTSVFVELPV